VTVQRNVFLPFLSKAEDECRPVKWLLLTFKFSYNSLCTFFLFALLAEVVWFVLFCVDGAFTQNDLWKLKNIQPGL